MSSLNDLAAFSPESQVWIFTADRKMNQEEAEKISSKLKVFSKSWISHDNKLKSEAFILHDIFIILVVDNTESIASGCSIDTAMRFIQTLQIDFDIDFLDRQSFVYIDDYNQVKLVRKGELAEKTVKGEINDNTLFYDTLVSDLKSFQTDLIKPRGSFWMKNM